ncbi:hypothetical protein [Paenibacillus mucilaginosus]|uniref:HPr kinase n=3 Tax=Paenibacillus mucilaginosus TaxID=61624 RepID=H6NEA9_9BACL|nr:hypothetical protein [Paenibacillus mucilaginosus]AEI46278.1 hypothetical protein KNP414_07792 [Paenibacillus mucilaginosus KNP414]AFC33885.1 hypothetical protein PM3016_7311 [Paenibacillus mucilaginosus 3016]AFH66214.1 hypothetical protein B2K_36905 [Paenibacillus mucilaginosus K02]MCG7213603.1 hypothetical protein [Paenibacillus mucilaginosus]WDM27584.1 hypothetical protein KCX80_35485 [Paenibacillus mucilaginosus]
MLMQTLYFEIAEHRLIMELPAGSLLDWAVPKFSASVIPPESPVTEQPDLHITVSAPYGQPFQSYDVEITQDDETIRYDRGDYLLTVSRDFRRAQVAVHDDFALNHALMLLYSGFIAHRGWGLMTHSSCIAQGSSAYLFAGQSGAGKSTAALLSRPRPVLSDEAALIRVAPDGVRVYNSPFRSDSVWNAEERTLNCELKGYHLLRQSLEIKREGIRSSQALMYLMRTIFYWHYDPQETAKVISMCRTFVEKVPFYELYFQKNDKFWKEISHEQPAAEYV